MNHGCFINLDTWQVHIEIIDERVLPPTLPVSASTQIPGKILRDKEEVGLISADSWKRVRMSNSSQYMKTRSKIINVRSCNTILEGLDFLMPQIILQNSCYKQLSAFPCINSLPMALAKAQTVVSSVRHIT
jgi:hypothetical protein